MTHPDRDDVVILQKRSNPSTVYLLGTPAAPVSSYSELATRPSRKPCLCQASARASAVCQGRRRLRVARHVPRRNSGVRRLNERGFTMAKTKTDGRTATAPDRARKSLAEPATLSNSDVACRAYDLYLARGCEHGHDTDDWLQAERELRAGVSFASP